VSGFLGLLAASVNSSRHTVTVGVSGVTVGYSGSAGSLTPTSYRSEAIQTIASDSTTYDFRVSIDKSSDGQSAFRYLLVENGSGTIVKYNSSDASYVTVAGGSISQWTFGDGSSPVWSSGDSAEDHVVVFYY
jgi:hypothetical protein